MAPIAVRLKHRPYPRNEVLRPGRILVCAHALQAPPRPERQNQSATQNSQHSSTQKYPPKIFFKSTRTCNVTYANPTIPDTLVLLWRSALLQNCHATLAPRQVHPGVCRSSVCSFICPLSSCQAGSPPPSWRPSRFPHLSRSASSTCSLPIRSATERRQPSSEP